MADQELLWAPPADVMENSRMGAYLRWLQDRDLVVVDPASSPEDAYGALWRWSVENLDEFWQTIWDYFDVQGNDAATVLADRSLPGARWFPGATLNYAEHLLRTTGDRPALLARSQTRDDVTVSWDELRDQVARVAAGLRRLGVQQGDRVVAYTPNIPETIIAFLAAASIGAVWSSCAPEFGVKSVVDRVRQVEPTVLFSVDGYRYGAKAIDRTDELAQIRAALPTLTATILIPYLDVEAAPDRVPDIVTWGELTSEPAELTFDPVPFDHPLYVLYSSGTTGLPKAIVHGHGGILLEHLKILGLHHDVGPDDRFTWFTTTGWMMWNYLVSSLAVEATAVLFDGDPGHPDLTTLWRMAADLEVTVFGVSAPYLLACRREGVTPGEALDLTRLRQVGSTGAPLPPEGFAWVYEAVGRDLQVVSASGGTDVCTAFVAASPFHPVRAGEIACRCLGAKVEAYDPDGNAVIGERGELVITAPMPSMPVGFWNDPDGSAYRAAYFEEFPGIWRHGDWIEITQTGACIITGRSDATLNRGGVRMGTSEFYSVVESVPGVADSLVVHHEDPDGGAGELVLFVVLEEDRALDDELRGTLARTLRSELSPRHVPDTLHAIPSVPRTISGKKMEVPVKRLLDGEPRSKVVNPGAMANPDSLDALLDAASE
jgi:acetoacetyl-CoA synthetase